MSFHGRPYKIMLCALALLLLCAAGQMERVLNADREAMGFARLQPLQNAPPVLAFTTVALGGFRGLIANALWLRMTELQEDNKYFEMVQLADWITKLQPRMVSGWEFLAWNMAYNISVKFKNPEDRWLWVERGIELLRDQGLSYNTNQPDMYQQLSWIYMHKIGANLDDAHMTYKLHLAQQMEQVFPDGHPNTNELEHPTDPLWQERVRKLREDFKMDPYEVAQVDKEYGPFDWRLPGAQAVYWAELGRIYGDKKDEEKLRREIFQTMRQYCFIGGGLPAGVTNITTDNFFLRPNLELIPTMSAIYEKMIAEEKDPNQVTSFKNAHKNFIKEAVPLLYVDGQEGKAEYWFNYLRKLYPNAFPPWEQNVDLERFVVMEITDDTGSPDQYKVADTLLGLINREYLCLILGEEDKAQNTHGLVRRIYDHYREQADSNGDRLKIPDLKAMYLFALNQLLDPNGPLSPYNRARLRTELGLPAAGAPTLPQNFYQGQTNVVHTTNNPAK